ncbi:extracellular solute-binding protein [Ruminococcaceae bacterium OttesenSCG-928-L11]|nr:extracellular solute-binding protein [Ruminococcaceae bacterium OttesenSCG-928-L11]
MAFTAQKKWRKQTLGILLTAMLCASAFAGCSDSSTSGVSTAPVANSTGGSTSSAAAADPASTAAPSGNFNAEGLPILNEPVDFEIVIMQQGTLKTANEKQCAINAVEKTNVNINWTEVPNASYTEKINILFASDSLPDGVCGDVKLITTYGDQLLDLKPYLADYAPTTTQFFTDRPEYPQALSDASGALKIVPIGDESLGNTIDSQLWINQDWLTNLGLDMPTTTAEFEAVLKAFKEQDANGNGDPNDEIPYSFMNVWGWARGIENMFGAFGVVENDNHVFLSPTDNSTVVFSAEEQGYYDFLKWMNSMYTQGLIDPEVFTHSQDQYVSKNAGKDIIGAYMEYGDTGIGNAVSSLNPEDQKFKHVVALKGPTGEQHVGLNNLTRGTGFMITNKCEMPEVLVRWYDWVNTDLDTFAEWRWGKEGEVWNYVDNGSGQKVPQQKYMVDGDYQQYGYQNYGEYNGAESFSGWCLAVSYEEKLSLMPPEVDTDRKKPAAIADIAFGLNPLPAGIADPQNEDQRALIKADLDNYLLRFISDSIINGIDDAKWNTHLGELEKLRVPEYKQLCQEFVDAIQSR